MYGENMKLILQVCTTSYPKRR